MGHSSSGTHGRPPLALTLHLRFRISAYVLSSLRPYGHLGMPDPDQRRFLDFFTQYEGQDTLPTFWLNQGLDDFTQPDWARYLKVVSAFQTNSLQPAWDTSRNGAVVSYSGANGTSAALTDTGTLVQFNLQQGGSSTLIYQRVHASDQAASPPYVPNWPAYTSTETLGTRSGLSVLV